MADTITAPTTELGAVHQVSSFSKPVLTEREINRDLRYPRSNQTYASMLNDAQVEGLHRSVMLPIRGYRWFINPNGAPDSAVQRIAAGYNLPVGPDDRPDRRRTQRRFSFDRHLEDALRGPVYGHYFFEQVFDVIKDGPANINGGWVAHLRKLAPRPPITVLEIRPARDGGLDYVRVPALNPDRTVVRTGTGVKLPVDRLVAYVWDQEGANWRGRSMLRSCYRPWKLKDRVLKVGAINIERAGGIPYVEAPEGATREQLQDLHMLAASFRVGQESGAALPHGAQLKFAQAAGGDQAVNYIRLQNEEMTQAWVQMLNSLGSTQNGSRALGETFADRADLVQRAVAVWFRDRFNEHVIEDDVELNEGADTEYAPLLDFQPEGDPLAAMADTIEEAQSAGALPANSAVAAVVQGRHPGRSRAAAMRAPVAAATVDDVPEAIRNAGVDFEALQATYLAATSRLARQWGDITAAQIDDLVAQASTATSVEELARIAVPAAGADILLAELTEVMHDGAAAAEAEAAHQGAPLADVDLDPAHAVVEARATATAELMAGSLSQSAASRAVSLSGSATGDDLAAAVREHLEGLAGRARDYELAGAVTHAQNEGRFTVMEQGPDGRLYASELNDARTCTFCDDVDGQEYPNMAEARRDYGGGHYVGCEGGNLCRGTLVKVYAEA